MFVFFYILPWKMCNVIVLFMLIGEKIRRPEILEVIYLYSLSYFFTIITTAPK